MYITIYSVSRLDDFAIIYALFGGKLFHLKSFGVKFSIDPALRPGRFRILICLCVCLSVCLFAILSRVTCHMLGVRCYVSFVR